MSDECFSAVINNDFPRVRALVKKQSLQSLKILYVRLKWSNFDLYVDYIRCCGREAVANAEIRLVLTQFDLNDDVNRYIGEFI